MNLTRKKEVENQFRKELEKQKMASSVANGDEGVQEKIKARERISKQLMRFLLLNDIDKYSNLDARNLSYALFDKIYSIREDERCRAQESIISASPEELKFNYVLKSLLSISKIIKTKREALEFLQKVIEKLTSDELDSLIQNLKE